MDDADPPSASKPLPRCKAILLCERVITDRDSGQPSLIGVVSEFGLSQKPGVLPPLFIYLELVDGIGRARVGVEITDLQSGDSIWTGDFVAEFADRIEPVSIIYPLHQVELPHAGAYDLVVTVDGRELERKRFVAVQD